VQREVQKVNTWMETLLDNLRDDEKKLLVSILKAVQGIRYGSVEITIQDSRVVQIDKTEKIRFDKQSSLDYQI
jgi:hypothetical protein